MPRIRQFNDDFRTLFQHNFIYTGTSTQIIGNDFYRYVNKKWLEDPKNAIPDDYSRWGGFVKLQDTCLISQIELVKELTEKMDTNNDEENKIAIIWKASFNRFNSWDKNEGNYTVVYSDMQTGLQVHILNTNLPIETFLIIYVQGYFFNKEFQFGQEVKVTGERCRNGVKELELVVQYPEVIWRREIQTHNNVGSQRKKMDPHERRSVYIKDSPIPGAGEGVFAKRSYGPRDLISYFGGLKTVRENFIFPNF